LAYTPLATGSHNVVRKCNFSHGTTLPFCIASMQKEEKENKKRKLEGEPRLPPMDVHS
jgi:hypothetical protein